MDIQNFIDEFKKTFIYDILCESLEDEQLFEHTIVGNQVIWMKEQARQMWDFWQQAQKVAVPQKTETVYLVWNEAHNECVGFTDKRDAKYASTGIQTSVSYSTLAGEFREIYEYQMDGSNFNITEIQIEAQEQVG